MTQNSFKDWKFFELVKGNWSTIKELIKVGIPAVLAIKFISTNPALVILITGIGKMILDTGHFYFKN